MHMPMNRTLAVGVLLLLAPAAIAQRQPLPGIPMTPPPVNHPGLMAQPLFGEAPSRAPADASNPAPANMPQLPAPNADTMGPKVDGKNLKRAVAKVKALKWLDSLAEAKARSAATGKPILWLQALGDIDKLA